MAGTGTGEAGGEVEDTPPQLERPMQTTKRIIATNWRFMSTFRGGQSIHCVRCTSLK
jgi:hypothetical protein